MLDLGCLYIDGESILVLFRKTKNGVTLKIRKPSQSPAPGQALKHESVYLKDNPQILADLKNGKVINLSKRVGR